MFFCFLAVLSVGAKQQHCSFYFLQDWRKKEGLAEEWGGKLKEGGEAKA